MVYTTFGDAPSAERASLALVSERLAASTNSFEVRSVYRWKGVVRREPEVGVLIKTSSALVPKLIARLRALHPYENPCAVEIPVGRGRREYLDWITECTTHAPAPRRRRPLP